MQYSQAEKYVSEFLQSRLSPSLYYHDFHHTMDVLNASVELAKEENVNNDNELTLLKTAALFHDTGYVNTRQNHEEASCAIAKEALPRFGYTEDQINIICKMIMFTKLPSNPQTPLEKILCDADLDYLGRDDFEKTGRKLFRELNDAGKIKNEQEWNEVQIKFLESHHYLTRSAIEKRTKKKEQHLAKLKKANATGVY